VNRAFSKAERKKQVGEGKRRPTKTPYSKDRWAEGNAGKYKPGGVLHVEREITGVIAVQILNNQR